MGDSKKSFLSWYFKTNLLVRILIGLVLGIIFGLIISMVRVNLLDAIKNAGDNEGLKNTLKNLESISLYLKPMGSILIRLLQMIVMPVIFFSLVVGASSIAPSRLGKVGAKIFVFYMLTSAFAVTLGLLFANIFRPGIGFNPQALAVAEKTITATKPDLVETLLSIIPTNPFASLATGQVLPIIFFSLIFGLTVAILKDSNDVNLKKSAESVFDFFNGAAEVMYKVVRGVLEYAPIGVFALIAQVFYDQGLKAFGPLLLITVTIFSAMAVHMFFVYGSLLTVNKLNLFKFFKMNREAMITAFVTRTSSGTLPISLKNAEENMGVHRNVCSFTLPLGATLNMDGTAIYLGVCALFISNAMGLSLSFSQQSIIVLTAVLASIGTAGVPGAGAIMLLMVLESINIKVAPGTVVALAYGAILGIDAILDMGRTLLNVSGDLAGTVIVAKSEKELDLSKWK